jgi:addiction module HigA family antidote
MISGASVLFGKTMVLITLKLWITTRSKAMPHLLDEIHPGEILLEEFMKPMNLTARQLAADIDVPASRISDIVNRKRPITADTALRLGIFFSMESRFWINLQSEYDIRIIERNMRDQIASRIRVLERTPH